jgi:hypothetical protein
MGFFDHDQAQGAYNQVYGGETPRHDVTQEVLAGAASFEAMHLYEKHREDEGVDEHDTLGKEALAGFAGAEVDKHFQEGGFDHLDQDQTRGQAQQQADYLWQQQYGQPAY